MFIPPLLLDDEPPVPEEESATTIGLWTFSFVSRIFTEGGSAPADATTLAESVMDSLTLSIILSVSIVGSTVGLSTIMLASIPGIDDSRNSQYPSDEICFATSCFMVSDVFAL